MVWYVILASLGGVGFGYVIFYRQYQHKDVVAELRKHLKGANEQLTYLQEEMEELQAQNVYLREQAASLLEKNDELSDVVAELGKYYVHIKKASEKTAELSKYLNGPDSELEERLGSLSEQEKNQMKKSFF
ncbi:MAG: hypothetical protein HXJ92_03160 [candidate division SR1 bacterium]|nr:hypothetical protein [candidate division SR1 bacterium]